MSQTTGKTSTYIRNANVKESTQIQTGFKKTRFLHQATAGDTTINTTSLTTPTGTVNYAAPNVSDLSRTNLQQWSSNFQLISSVRGYMMQNVSYVISGATTITLLDAALDGEIFEGIIDHNARTGVSLVDASPILASGTLAAGQTDFNVGTPFQVGLYPSQTHGIVLVYVDGQLVTRNTGNNPPGSGVEGSYYEVHSGGGLGQIIRLNTPDLINDRQVSVVSLAGFVERPNGSFMAVMETLQGQIDAMVPTLAALAGVPQTNYQGTPNNIDLKTFGDRVLNIEAEQITQNNRLTTLETITILSATSSTKTPIASNHWHQLTGNSIVLPPGTWRLFGQADFSFSGTPGYTQAITNWFGSNGADSPSSPTTALSAVPGLTVLSSTFRSDFLPASLSGAIPLPMTIVKCDTNCTVFAVTYATMTTPANARITVYVNAERII